MNLTNTEIIALIAVISALIVVAMIIGTQRNKAQLPYSEWIAEVMAKMGKYEVKMKDFEDVSITEYYKQGMTPEQAILDIWASKEYPIKGKQVKNEQIDGIQP